MYTLAVLLILTSADGRVLKASMLIRHRTSVHAQTTEDVVHIDRQGSVEARIPGAANATSFAALFLHGRAVGCFRLGERLLEGKVVCIDVSVGTQYTISSDKPLSGCGGTAWRSPCGSKI